MISLMIALRILGETTHSIISLKELKSTTKKILIMR